MKSRLIIFFCLIVVFISSTGCDESKSDFLADLGDSLQFLPGAKHIAENGDTVIIIIDTRPNGVSSVGWVDLHRMLVLYEVYMIEHDRRKTFARFYQINYLIPQSGLHVFSYGYRSEDIYSAVDELIGCKTLYQQGQKIIGIDVEQLASLNDFCSKVRAVAHENEGKDVEDFVNVAFSAVMAACNDEKENKYVKVMASLRSFFEFAYQESQMPEINELYQITNDICLTVNETYRK